VLKALVVGRRRSVFGERFNISRVRNPVSINGKYVPSEKRKISNAQRFDALTKGLKDMYRARLRLPAETNFKTAQLA